MRIHLSVLLLLVHKDLRCIGQQIPQSTFSFDLLGLSKGCLAAVNATITSCPPWLPKHVAKGDASFKMLDHTRLSSLCATNCAQDLAAARAAIANACTADTDVMVPGGNVAYPATYLADRYLYAIQLNCLKSLSGEYCDSVVAEWIKESRSSNWTVAQNCSHCQLGIQQLQLSSPFGYNEDAASKFASLTASCTAEGYAYPTPPPYALNATQLENPPREECTNPYTIQEEDTCVSISVAMNVSTYGLIHANGLDISCNLLPSPGTTICLPETCETYQLDMYDRCEHITAGAQITTQQLLAWNPMINSFCSDLYGWYGWNLCVSSPNGVVNPGQSDTVPTVAPVPENANGESNTRCGKWHLVQEGDQCDSISLAYGITLDDFYFLNPHVDSQCLNLWLNASYCVKAVGDIATYPGYPTSTPATVFPRPTPTPTSSYPPFVTPPLAPKAPGTMEDCDEYDNAFTDIIAEFFDLDEMNSCTMWAFSNEVSVEDLLRWNPSLSADNCRLQSGKSYCIKKSADMGNTPTGTGDSASPTGAASSTSSSAPPISTSVPISTDGSCGTNSPTNATCASSGFGSCCSSHGWCGDSESHCGAGCQSGNCTQPNPGSGPLSSDGSCGSNTANNAVCEGSGFGSCCSSAGWCGNSEGHCGAGCQSGKCTTPGTISIDGKCGPNTSNNATCIGSGFGSCCSTYGWCGDSEIHCGKGNCYSGKCTT